ncbi:acetylcholinesterase-1-like [Varroa destructor]|uniref:Carboxylesterase type B domain-containing protein n=1 Tax=Varroa destructor TaxID=109461 RepID=A0A7M7JN93_VARDE|nr:acetylcholinesterase-1-like [Varroa destructor]
MAAQTSLVWMLIISLGLINDSFSQHKTIILNEVSYSSELKSAENNIGFYAFYGIPYARQPVGRFRFTRPAPIEELFSWNLSIDEIKKYYHTPRTMPKACAQIDPFTNMTDLTTSSEDCLRVDLYITNKTFGDGNAAMAILIEGFDFKQSVAHKIQPERSFLVEDSGIGILAVVHSRLGALGYLTTEDDEGPANLGLWDQHMALQFLKNSASTLKADANRIIVLGFGSGGISASIHIINGLNSFIKTAVISGGSALGPDANVHFAKKRAADFGYEVGCTSSSSRKFIECLRNLKVETLLEKGAHPRFIFGPVADKNHTDDNQKSYLSDWPEKLARTATFDNISAIVYGYAEDAGSFRYSSFSSGPYDSAFEPTVSSIMNTNATVEGTSSTLLRSQENILLNKRIEMYLAPYQEYVDTLKTVTTSVQLMYFRNYTDHQVSENQTSFADIMCSVLTDYLSFTPVVSLAHLHAEAKIRRWHSGNESSTGVSIYVRSNNPQLPSFRQNLQLFSGQSLRNQQSAIYMDDLLQLVGVEGTAKAQNKDQKIRRKWAVYLQSLSTSTRSPFFLTEYNPKLSTFAFITKISNDNFEEKSPYQESQRIFWSDYIPRLQDNLDAMSAKLHERRDAAVASARNTWGVTAGLVLASLMMVVLGVLFWKQKSKNSKSGTARVSLKPALPTDSSS